MVRRRVAALVVGGLLLTACGSSSGPKAAAPTAAASTSTTALTPIGFDLGRLLVAPLGPTAGLAPASFGPEWADTDHNGCDTRDDVLSRDLTAVVLKAGSRCVVQSGTLADPYTGTTVAITPATVGAVTIDHVVPLGRAWAQGAAAWSEGDRSRFANDLVVPELLAVGAGAVAAKGDQGPDTWKPPDRAFWCLYATDWVQVKVEWKLTVTAAEKAALLPMLAGCGPP
jgi:hypothetical protein